MSICNGNNVKLIKEFECLSDSINTINSNFANLSAIACNLKERIDTIRLSRTFFYYGPNSDIVAYNDGKNQFPSDFTITTFVNSPEELDLQSTSRLGDVVYIVHQRTGYTPFVGIRPTQSNLSIRSSPISFSSNLGAQYGADFLPGSSFLRYRYSIPAQIKPNVITSFKYTRVNSNGLILSTPVYTPVILRNDNNFTQVYRVKWTVINPGVSNMPEGNYQFEFGIDPGQSLNFKKRMQTWLETNIGRFNANIEGVIEIFVTPETRRANVKSVDFFSTRSSLSPGQNQTTEIDIEVQPIFRVWKLTYERRSGRLTDLPMYYINNGWPRIFRAQTSGINATNWNQPQTWTTYNSW